MAPSWISASPPIRPHLTLDLKNFPWKRSDDKTDDVSDNFPSGCIWGANLNMIHFASATICISIAFSFPKNLEKTPPQMDEQKVASA
jgi:hypothetical protein